MSKMPAAAAQIKTTFRRKSGWSQPKAFPASPMDSIMDAVAQ
jgi:hypothetical protein